MGSVRVNVFQQVRPNYLAPGRGARDARADRSKRVGVHFPCILYLKFGSNLSLT